MSRAAPYLCLSLPGGQRTYRLGRETRRALVVLACRDTEGNVSRWVREHVGPAPAVLEIREAVVRRLLELVGEAGA